MTLREPGHSQWHQWHLCLYHELDKCQWGRNMATGGLKTLARAGWQHSASKAEACPHRESVRGSTFVLGRAAATVQAQLGTGWSCSPVPERRSLVHSSRQQWRLGTGCCPGGALLPRTWAVVAKSPQACRSSQVTIWLGCMATMPWPMPSAASSKSSWVVVSPSEPLSRGSHHLKPLTKGDCS